MHSEHREQGQHQADASTPGDGAALAGRVALVTGGGSGIGLEIAHQLYRAGAEVAVTYRTSGGSIPEQFASFSFDIADGQESVDAIVDTIHDRYGRLDCLVNNIGGLVARVSLEQTTYDLWKEVFTLNVDSAFLFSQSALRRMNAGARIVNIASLTGQNGGGVGYLSYSAAKAAVLGLTRALAKEVAERDIGVNAVSPGYIDQTPFHATFSTAQERQNAEDALPVSQLGTPRDVAHLVLAIATAPSAYLTGATFSPNGGEFLV